jgi:hypothetical protein
MQHIVERWRACGERDEAARRELYLATRPLERVALLEVICELGQWATLVWAVRDVGLLPGQVWALDGARELGDYAEPLWVFLWQELAGLGLDATLTDHVLEVLSEGGAGTLYKSAERGGATWLLQDLFDRQSGMVRRGDLIGPLNALWSVAPLWSTQVQLLCAQASSPLPDQELVMASFASLAEAATRGVARAQQWVRWLVEALVRSDASWQPALELLWGAVQWDDAVVAYVWARQEVLHERGRPMRWLESSLASRVAGEQGREAALLGLPWSLDVLLGQLRVAAPRASEYTWLISPPSDLSPEISRALASVVRLQHTRLDGAQLVTMLAALPLGTSRWAEPVWLELVARPEAAVMMELCRLIERLGLSGGRGWLEAQLKLGGARLQEAALNALRVVGDVRSAGAIRALIAARPALAFTGQQVLTQVLARDGAPADGSPDAVSRALAPRGSRALATWSGVAMAPRVVSAQVFRTQRMWRDAAHLEREWSLALWWPIVLLASLALWFVVPLPWQLAKIVEDILGVALLATSFGAPIVCVAALVRLPAGERRMLEMGDALSGDVIEVDGERRVAFRDLSGVARTAPIRQDQREAARVGTRVQLMHLRADGVDHVLLTPALESDEYGALVPAAKAREMNLLLALGSQTLWVLASLPAVWLVLVLGIAFLNVIFR